MKLWLMAALISVMTVAAYPQEAIAGHMTVKALISFCDAESVSGRNLCEMYIGGVVDGYEANSEENPWCIPAVVTVGEVAKDVMRELKTQLPFLPAGPYVAFYLTRAFPC